MILREIIFPLRSENFLCVSRYTKDFEFPVLLKIAKGTAIDTNISIVVYINTK